ncbi:MAG TPA: hemolysin III family protein [Aquabacterium sp.]|nr:hemolysin III family protein [Aquabacterium sp.]
MQHDVAHDIAFTQTGREERANAASHAAGLLLAMLAVPALAQQLDIARHPLRELGVQVFIASMVLMYGVSAAYHAVPVGPAKRWLRKCDHAVIFVFIAGSFTPFGLLALQHGHTAGPLDPAATLAAVWVVALAGMALKFDGRLRHRLLSTGLYLGFGWLVAAVAQPTLLLVPPSGLRLVVAGGVAYSLGSLFFLLDRRMPYSHLIWHLFVITGSLCHFMAVQRML